MFSSVGIVEKSLVNHAWLSKQKYTAKGKSLSQILGDFLFE